MSDDLKSTVLRKLEALSYGLDSMTSIGVSGDVFENALDTDFQASASISQHIIEMWL